MQPILSDFADKAPRNAPRDMLSLLYREIGISAVAAALEVTSSDALEQRETPKQKRETLVRRAA